MSQATITQKNIETGAAGSLDGRARANGRHNGRHNGKVDAANLAEVYRASATRFADSPAFATRGQNKEFTALSFGELYETGLRLATGLIDLGLRAREHVVLLADNRAEWIMADYGIILAGAADVPRGTDVTDGDIRYIVAHSDARFAFVENQDVLAKIERNREFLPAVEHIVLMSGPVPSSPNLSSRSAVHAMRDLIIRGGELRAGGDRQAEARIAGIRPDDLFTIIYTSGTTGSPKGVMLTHANMISQLRSIPIEIGPRDRVLSILPVWHIFERVFEMATIALGVPQYYSSIRAIREDLQIVRPTFMASAPRLWESVYQGIQNNVQNASPVKRGLFRAAYFCAQRVQRAVRFLRGNLLDLTGRGALPGLALALGHLPPLALFYAPYLLLDLIVLKKIRGATGGELRGSVSGGGALPVHVDEFFNTIGIPVYEGYGLTETSPGLAFRTPARSVIGSVGPLFPGTELRLVDLNTGEILYPPRRGIKGEIHVRGPQVMKGYYKNPEATARVLSVDGWFNTGDLGIMTFNDTLKIVGRSKETIVLLNGENVEPVPIENRLAQSALIDQIMVVGQDQKFLGALVVAALPAFASFGATHAELARSEEVRRALLKEVKAILTAENGFKAFEKVADLRVLPKPLEVGDELSAKMSMKRHVITEKYGDLIKAMYV